MYIYIYVFVVQQSETKQEQRKENRKGNKLELANASTNLVLVADILIKFLISTFMARSTNQA